MSKSALILVLLVMPMLLLSVDVSDAAIRRNYREGGRRQRYLRRDSYERVMSRRPWHPWNPPIGRREQMRVFDERNPRRHTYLQTTRRFYQPPQPLIVEPPRRRDFQPPTVDLPGTQTPEEAPRRPLILRPLPGPLDSEELIPESAPRPDR